MRLKGLRTRLGGFKAKKSVADKKATSDKPLKKPKKFDLKKRNPEKASDYKQIISSRKEIIYSAYAKRMLKKYPEMISSFYDMFKHVRYRLGKQVREVTLKSGERVTFSLNCLTRPSKSSFLTTNFLLFEISSSNSKTVSKFFVKHVDLLNPFFRRAKGTNEMLALDVIRKAGFNIIPSYFAYSDKTNSFIFYRYQEKLMPVEKAFELGHLTQRDIKKIRIKLYATEEKVNDFFKKKYSSLRADKSLNIYDIYPVKGKAQHSLSVFIDLKTKKLFIYDPLLSPADLYLF